MSRLPILTVVALAVASCQATDDAGKPTPPASTRSTTMQLGAFPPTSPRGRAFRFGMDSANQHPILMLLAMLGLTLLAAFGAQRAVAG